MAIDSLKLQGGIQSELMLPNESNIIVFDATLLKGIQMLCRGIFSHFMLHGIRSFLTLSQCSKTIQWKQNKML